MRQLPSELTERNSTKNSHMFGSEYDLKMHMSKLWGIPSTLKLEAKKPLIFDAFTT